MICLPLIFVVRELPSDIKNHLLMSQSHPWAGSSILHQHTNGCSSQNRPNRIVPLGLGIRWAFSGECISLHGKCPYDVLTVKKVLWSILSPQLDAHLAIGAQYILYIRLLSSHMLFSYLLSFLSPARFYDLKDRNCVLFVFISLGHEEEKLNIHTSNKLMNE